VVISISEKTQPGTRRVALLLARRVDGLMWQLHSHQRGLLIRVVGGAQNPVRTDRSQDAAEGKLCGREL